jgi:glyoxylase-like metal-dependent hydrolase (beta-lactamase superfamily II)
LSCLLPAVASCASYQRVYQTKERRDQMCDAGAMGQLEQIWSDAAAEVHQIVVGPMDNNVYILRCRRTGDAMLIDAANEHEELLQICRQLGVNQVVETHGHWDHIQAVPAVREAGISVAVTSADAGMLPSYDLILEDDEQLSVGDLRLKTLATPGHTPGSICFAVEGTNLLFTGDTLFPGGPGNTSFENADFNTIIQSIDRRIFAAFDPDTLVLPGHGTSTTVGNEAPHLDEWVERGW